ncbi:hypothetical protein OG596_24200 [Streptomyces sp. NBC_01102]|uniref:hypothetical protein n=1 Tax=Streptomyces sp. NBC_01102 TaxID=2903749 RepID=UPI00386F0188|nr:hypothetical protein OG596_24200 [Streptomyces sp. NBC_01102]
MATKYGCPSAEPVPTDPNPAATGSVAVVGFLVVPQAVPASGDESRSRPVVGPVVG